MAKSNLVRAAATAAACALTGALLVVSPAHGQMSTVCPVEFSIQSLAGEGRLTTATRLDTGSSGWGHNRDIAEARKFGLAMSCTNATPPCDDCSIDGIASTLGRCSNDRTVECNVVNGPDLDDCGGARCDFFPFSTTHENVGGFPLCIDNRLRSQPSGTIDPTIGSVSMNLPVLMDMYIGISGGQPCPVCVGDAIPNNGIRGGICVDGERDGLPCDVTGTDATFGDTSLDCPPATGLNISGTGFQRDLSLTTANVSLSFGVPCDVPIETLDCPCAVCAGDGQVPCASDADCTAAAVAGPCNATPINGSLRLPNSCNDGICTPTGAGAVTGECLAGPDSLFCDGFLRANGEPILPCLDDTDCIAQDPVCPSSNCGNCTISKRRPCFLDPIVANGTPDPYLPVLAGVVCLSGTTSFAINSALGLAGPERLSLEMEMEAICAAVDNCPLDDNPDQENSDCPDPTFIGCVGCAGTVPPLFAGCCDGGDACDVCPAYADNTRCDPADSSSATIDHTVGGTVQTDEVAGTVSATVVIPPNALAADTTISITENGPATRFSLKKAGGTATVLSVSLRPEAQEFLLPVQVTLRWDDRDIGGDDPELVDRGLCVGGADADLPCDHDGDCASDDCTVNSNVEEPFLILKRNNARFSRDGFGVSPYDCASHAPGGPCETATADCSDAAGTGRSTVAKCCDAGAGPVGTRTFGEWTFETCDFSEFLVGLTAGALVPGKGSPKTDCILEFAPNGPLNDKYLDNKGLPNFKQECRDGDPVCDRDRLVNGECLLEIGLCANVDDPRLLKQDTVQCTPSDVASFTVLRPRLGSENPVESENLDALLAAALELGGIGPLGTRVNYVPPLSQPEACSAPARIKVPLGGSNGDRKGKAILKISTETAPAPGKTSGTKDKDKLKIFCLPPT